MTRLLKSCLENTQRKIYTNAVQNLNTMSRELSELHPTARAKCLEFLNACMVANHPVLVVQTYRSFEEQEALYAKGRTRPGPIVTHARAGESFHNYRCAWDICFADATTGKLSWAGPWDSVGDIALKLGIIWGGHFTNPDRPHLEYHPGESLEQMRTRVFVRQIV